MAGDEDEDRYMSIGEVAELLDCSTRTVQRLMTAWEQSGGEKGLAFVRVTDQDLSWRRPLRQAAYDLTARRAPRGHTM